MKRTLFADSDPWKEFEYTGALHTDILIHEVPTTYQRLGGATPEPSFSVNQELSFAATRSNGVISIEIVIDSDTLEISAPESLYQNPAAATEDVAQVTVNEHSIEIDNLEFRDLMMLAHGKKTLEQVTVSEDVQDLSLYVDDPEKINRNLMAFNLATRNYYLAHPVPQGSCAEDCTMCGVAGVGYILSWAVLIATGCGAVVGCILWGLGHSVAITGFAYSCATCIDCILGPDPSPPDPPDGVCPAGYHECCDNQCCSDLNPPPSC